MRVLRILTRPNLGGPAKQAVALWHAHRELGVQTLWVTGVCAEDEPSIDPGDHDIPVLDAATALNRGVEASGACILPSLRRAPGPGGDWRTLRILRALIGSFRPDVVHTHTTKAGLLGRLAAPRRQRIAHTFHGLVLRDYWSRPVSTAVRLVENRLAARTEIPIAVSETCADELAELGVVARQRLHVVPPAVVTDGFRTNSEAKRRLELDPERLVVGFVGRLAPVKQVGVFLDVLARLPEAQGVICGDGVEREAIAAAGLPNVRWFGAVDDLTEVVPAFDVLLMPSRREGFPVAAVEVAAAGVPTVGFDVPGVRDVVAPVDPALLVPAADGAAGLAACIRSDTSDAARSERLRALRDECQPLAVAKRLLELYRAQP